MRIGIQILSLRPGQVGGQEVLVRRLLARIAPMLGQDRIVVFLRPEVADDAAWRSALTHPAIETACERPEQHYGEGYADWSLQLLRDAAIDVVFFPLFFFFPRPLPIPVAVHVPDLQHEYCPEYFPPEQLSWRRERIPESVAMADAVITGSDFSAATLRERLNADPERLHVIPNGGFLSEEIRSAEHEPTSLAGLPISSPFIFYPAADWPHKNHETLLKAMAILGRRGRTEHLVLSGMLTQSGKRLREMASHLSILERVHFLGCVEQRQLVAIYRRAVLMAFPSRFEGFGLPLVEAMQLGCPIVASRAAAVVEVAGDAAVFCDDTPEAWAETLAATLDSPEVLEDLRRRGAVREKDFDWDQAAVRYLALFRQLAVAGPRGS
jgi:glycosyltransferase involved in cell wall biosynthesis